MLIRCRYFDDDSIRRLFCHRQMRPRCSIASATEAAALCVNLHYTSPRYLRYDIAWLGHTSMIYARRMTRPIERTATFYQPWLRILDASPRFIIMFAITITYATMKAAMHTPRIWWLSWRAIFMPLTLDYNNWWLNASLRYMGLIFYACRQPRTVLYEATTYRILLALWYAMIRIWYIGPKRWCQHEQLRWASAHFKYSQHNYIDTANEPVIRQITAASTPFAPAAKLYHRHHLIRLINIWGFILIIIIADIFTLIFNIAHKPLIYAAARCTSRRATTSPATAAPGPMTSDTPPATIPLRPPSPPLEMADMNYSPSSTIYNWWRTQYGLRIYRAVTTTRLIYAVSQISGALFRFTFFFFFDDLFNWWYASLIDLFTICLLAIFMTWEGWFLILLFLICHNGRHGASFTFSGQLLAYSFSAFFTRFSRDDNTCISAWFLYCRLMRICWFCHRFLCHWLWFTLPPGLILHARLKDCFLRAWYWATPAALSHFIVREPSFQGWLFHYHAEMILSSPAIDFWLTHKATFYFWPRPATFAPLMGALRVKGDWLLPNFG